MPNIVTGKFGPDMVGVLDREILVTLVDISRKGCLLVSSSAVATGTVALLSVDIDGVRYSDDVRVARCAALAGAGERHQVGVEFLWLRRPGHDSLRLYAASRARAPRRLGAPEGWAAEDV